MIRKINRHGSIILPILTWFYSINILIDIFFFFFFFLGSDGEQGMDDRVVPPSTTDFVHRILPGATIHKLPYEGHFSYFYFCDKCHRQIFNTLFVTPQGPLDIADEVVDKTSIDDEEEEKKSNIELLDPEEVNLGDSATTSHPIFIV